MTEKKKGETRSETDTIERYHVMATSSSSRIGLFVLIGIMIFPKSSYAYIDPGTGSYLFQMLMAGLLGSAFALKMAWRNIKNYISNRVGTKKSEDDLR